MKADMTPPPKTTVAKKPLTEIDALARIQKILDQLDGGQRRKVLAFLSAE